MIIAGAAAETGDFQLDFGKALAIGIFQDTTLVAIIGMFDLLNAARTAASADQAWLGFYAESYVFAALVYFVFCFSASRYSLWLERHLRPA